MIEDPRPVGHVGIDEFLPPEPPPTFAPPAAEPDDDDDERPTDPANRRFWIGVLVITAVAAAVRFRYVLTDHRVILGGDAFDYHYSALRLADGLGFTRAFGDVGAPAAHHTPGWTTVLGGVSWLGFRSLRDHQIVGIVLGLILVVLVALIGRRYFNPRTGLIAASVAAVYPGFWLLEGNVLSEPLGLVLLGVLLLLVADLREKPTWIRAILVGVVAGALALTRPEQLVVAALIVAPILLGSRVLSTRQRLARLAVVAVVGAAVLAPWTIYNSTRFEDTVLISTGEGGTFLSANSAPGSFSGPRMGFWDTSCLADVIAQHRGLDESQVDTLARSQAADNLRNNIGRLPVVVPARLGRMLAVFHPSETVSYVAGWLVVDTSLVWAWVASFWVILVAAIVGYVMALRRKRQVWPLVVPFAVPLVLLLVSYGEPRYDAMADLGLIVLAAFAVDRIVDRIVSRRTEESPPPPPAPRRPSAPAGRGGRARPGRLPSVHVPR